jgi:hypothetical protein
VDPAADVDPAAADVPRHKQSFGAGSALLHGASLSARSIMPDALRIDVSYSRTALYSCTSTSDISLLAKTVYKQSLEMDLRESHFSRLQHRTCSYAGCGHAY